MNYNSNKYAIEFLKKYNLKYTNDNIPNDCWTVDKVSFFNANINKECDYLVTAETDCLILHSLQKLENNQNNLVFYKEWQEYLLNAEGDEYYNKLNTFAKLLHTKLQKYHHNGHDLHYNKDCKHILDRYNTAKETLTNYENSNKMEI